MSPRPATGRSGFSCIELHNCPSCQMPTELTLVHSLVYQYSIEHDYSHLTLLSMDVAYDAIQDSALKPSTSNPGTNPVEQPPPEESLNAEFQHAFQAVSASPWGSKLGGWFSSARKQGETFVADLQKEAQDAGEQATQGWSSLREQVEKRTRGMSLGAEDAQKSDVKGVVPGEEEVLADSSASKGATAEAEALKTAPESLPADIVKEATTLVASFRVTAAAKLKDLQKAEDAADEALLKFGTNLRNFLRDAVVISAPTSHDASKPRGTDTAGNEVLFETSEPGTGKKVFHGTRLDAQLHAIHTTSTSFTEDPGQGEQWEEWQRTFDIGAQTEAIAKDLEGFEGLRGAMEKLVPEMVEYKVFWMRYYFLRKAVEEDERRRREVLKGKISSWPYVESC